MTRPGYVTAEFPVAEAEAMLKRLGPDGAGSMSATECDAAQSGRERLQRAVKVERQPGGTCYVPGAEPGIGYVAPESRSAA